MPEDDTVMDIAFYLANWKWLLLERTQHETFVDWYDTVDCGEHEIGDVEFVADKLYEQKRNS